MKLCRSPPGGFASPVHTPLTPMKTPNEFSPLPSPAKCHDCLSAGHYTCTPTVGPVPVSDSVPTIQPSPHTNFASTPNANSNPPGIFAPLEEDTFPNHSHDSPSLINLMFQKLFTLTIFPLTLLLPPPLFLNPNSGKANHSSPCPVSFPHSYLNAHLKFHATATSH